MSARKGLQTPKGGEPEPKRRALEFDTCNFLVDAVSPAFELNRVLLRRVFFINEDKSKYVSIGLSPTLNYQPFVEFGDAKNKP